jgi:hypothetical protein
MKDELVTINGDQYRKVRCPPNRDILAMYPSFAQGRDGLRNLKGMAHVPEIRQDGLIINCLDYWEDSELLHPYRPEINFPFKSTYRDAQDAYARLLHPFSEYRFTSDESSEEVDGRMILLAYILSAFRRPWMRLCPIFIIRCAMAGTGKGKLIRCVNWMAFESAPIITTYGQDGTEFEKRLGAELMLMPPSLFIDNANTKLIEGDLLESLITEGTGNIRVLGESRSITCNLRGLIQFSGTNPAVTGDMARRALIISLLPVGEDPELAKFELKPLEMIMEKRDEYVRDVYTILQAYRQDWRHGMDTYPREDMPDIGSFDEWDVEVRGCIHWLTGGEDIAEAFKRNKAEDPRRQGDAYLLEMISNRFGSVPFTAKMVFGAYTQVDDCRAAVRAGRGFPGWPTQAQDEALHDALDEVLDVGKAKLGAGKFGWWCRNHSGAYVGGFQLTQLAGRASGQQGGGAQFKVDKV